MFHPAANRLAGFLEVSALFINLAHAGGLQLKGGYLKIESTKTGGGFGRKSTSWKERKESRWCAVRDSYIVVVEEPGEVFPTLRIPSISETRPPLLACDLGCLSSRRRL